MTEAPKLCRMAHLRNNGLRKAQLKLTCFKRKVLVWLGSDQMEYLNLRVNLGLKTLEDSGLLRI